MKVDLSYPKKFICVQSSSLPEREYSFNEIANHIAEQSKRSPYERMQNLITDNCLDQARKTYLL